MWPVSCILQDCGLFIHIQHNCSSPLGAVKLAGTLYTHTQLKQIALTDKLCFRQKNPLAHSAWIIHKLASHQRWTNHAPIPLHLLMWLFSRSSAYFKLCWWSTFTPNTLNSFLKEGCRFELHHRQFWVADFFVVVWFWQGQHHWSRTIAFMQSYVLLTKKKLSEEKYCFVCFWSYKRDGKNI